MSDFTLGDTLYFKFTTRAFATGIPTTLGGTPVVSAYEDDSLTQITAGITLTADFDSVTGLNHLTVVATGANGFETGKHYQLVITTGTVGGVSVVGEVVGQFSLDQVAKAVWDRVLSGATHNIATSAGRRLRNIQDFGIYDMASVWVDEVAGSSTGTTDGEDATVTNRANDFDNAQTVAASVGLDNIHVQNGNTITLTATINGFNVWSGPANEPGTWTLALGGQDIGLSTFSGATVSGIGTGTTPHFRNCHIGTATLPPCSAHLCLFTATLTLGSAGAYRFHHCLSGVAGAGAPTIDMGAAVGATTLELRDWRGGITLSNLAAGDVVTLDGMFGTITLNGADATVEIRGTYKALTNNLTGSPSVNTDGALSGADLVAALADTNELQTDWTNDGRLDVIQDAILAMLDDARGEPAQGAPAVNPDAMTKLDYLYKAWRNRSTQTATEYALYADNTTTVDHKATVSDDSTTFDRGEVATGP